MTTQLETTPGLGAAIRQRRREEGLTLVAVAERSGLSQPFLSQVENGRSTPSMDSLYRIAGALDTTPQALFGTGAPVDASPRVIRAGDPATPSIDTPGDALRRLLLPGDAPFHVIEFDGLATEFHDSWQHSGFEALYVLAGPVEIELDGELITLSTGDFISYPAEVPHRHRSPLGAQARALLIETSLQRAQHGTHSLA